MTERRRRGPVELATWRTLRDIERVHGAHEALAASALILAQALDAGAGAVSATATAAVAHELRATLTALTEAGETGDTDPLADLTAILSSPVEYAPQS